MARHTTASLRALIADKRRARNAKRRDRQEILIDDYVANDESVEILVRQALVREQAGRLLLLPNAPETWWAAGPLALTTAPTPAGHLTFSLVPDGNGTHVLAWELNRISCQALWPLMLVLQNGWSAEGDIRDAETPWGAPGMWLAEAGRLSLRRSNHAPTRTQCP